MQTEVIVHPDLNKAMISAGLWISARTGKLDLCVITTEKVDGLWTVKIIYIPNAPANGEPE